MKSLHSPIFILLLPFSLHLLAAHSRFSTYDHYPAPILSAISTYIDVPCPKQKQKNHKQRLVPTAMEHFHVFFIISFILPLLILPTTASSAPLRQNYYRNICSDVESIVRAAVTLKFQQTFITAPATLRLFFHDCFVRGCDASVLLASPNSRAEKDAHDNLSLAGDGFDTIIKAKDAVDRNPRCRNKVSCADILAMATRDVVALVGGPSYAVELGRLDGRISTKPSVKHRLPQPNFNLDQLNSMFASHGLNQNDMIALSGAHSIGFSHCSRFANRIYGFRLRRPIDPTMNANYARQLQKMCPKIADPRIAIGMDATTPRTFDNVYYKNLQQGKGLFTSDQSLFTDTRSRDTVNLFAADIKAFEKAFIVAITKLGRVGVKTGSQGEIRHDCTTVN